MATLAQIKTDIKRTFGDESGVQVTDADIVRWANNAQLQVVLENESLMQTSALADVVTGTAEYALPTNLLILQGLAYKGPSDTSFNRLRGMDRVKFDEYIEGWDGSTYQQGLPLVYFVWAGKVTLYPTPDHTKVGAIKVYYNRRPVDLVNDADVSELPELYHNAITNICLTNAYEMDEDWDSVSNKGQQVNADIKLLRGREDWKAEEIYPTISVRAEDMGF